VPDWMPSLLMLICNKRSEEGVKQVISTTITRFWKTHIAWWRSYQCFIDKFSREQLEILEEFKGNHYYFA